MLRAARVKSHHQKIIHIHDLQPQLFLGYISLCHHQFPFTLPSEDMLQSVIPPQNPDLIPLPPLLLNESFI